MICNLDEKGISLITSGNRSGFSAESRNTSPGIQAQDSRPMNLEPASDLGTKKTIPLPTPWHRVGNESHESNASNESNESSESNEPNATNEPTE